MIRWAKEIDRVIKVAIPKHIYIYTAHWKVKIYVDTVGIQKNIGIKRTKREKERERELVNGIYIVGRLEAK